MHILIAGGTGLMGRALVDSLLADGHSATILTRSPQNYQGDLPTDVKLAQWDGRTTGAWGNLVNGADAVVNLAGESLADGRWSAERKRRIVKSRVEPGKALAEAISQAETKPRVFIQASAVGYYGPGDNTPLPESAPPGNDFPAQVCIEWEASSAAVETLGVRRAVIRTGIVLSTRGGAFPKLLLPFRLFVGGPIGNGRQYFPWIHIDDQIRAIRFLIENEEARGSFNLAAPNPPTNREFMQAVGKAMQRPALLPAPAFALRLLFGEMSTILLEGQQAVPHALEAAGFTFAFSDATEAVRDILQRKK